MTAAEIIRRAMLKVGILTKTETPAADEENDALDSLNSMLSSWSNDSMLIYSRTLEPFTLVTSTTEYTIGPSQTFNTVRPTYIVDAYIRDVNIDYPVNIITDEVYAGVDIKTDQSRPYFLNYNNDFPSAKIKLYPAPDKAYTLYLLSEKPITSLDRTTEISLPPGWEDALVYNLAIRLAPEYGQAPDELTYQIARETKGAIQRSVLKSRSMDAQPPNGRRSNIYNGSYR